MKIIFQVFLFCLGLLAIALGVACAASPKTAVPLTPTVIPSPVPAATVTPAPTRTRLPIIPAIPFAAMLAVPADRANVAGVEAARAEFQRLKALGINIVVQLFTPQTTLYDWQAFLDGAAQENLAVVAGFLDAPPGWNGAKFDLGINEAFLIATQRHPALYAYLVVDDPFGPKFNGTFTTDRLQILYKQVKSVAPNARVMVQFNRSISKAEQERNPRNAFKAGVCDICVIGATEFRNLGDGNKFRRDDLNLNQTLARAVIKREDPKAQIWTTLQTFGAIARIGNDEASTYYMPSADEIKLMMDFLLAPDLQAKGKLDGFVWQQWAPDLQVRDAATNTLWDPDFNAQRERVKSTAKQLGLPVPP